MEKKGMSQALIPPPPKAGPWPHSHALPTGSLSVLQKPGATHNPSGLSRVGRRLETEEALGELFGKVKSSWK